MLHLVWFVNFTFEFKYMDKLKVVTDYAKLTPELLELFSETYPHGIVGKTIRFPNSKGEIVTAVRLETEERIYLVKLSAKAKEILTEDDLDAMIRPLGKDAEADEAEEEPDEDAPKDEPEED